MKKALLIWCLVAATIFAIGAIALAVDYVGDFAGDLTITTTLHNGGNTLNDLLVAGAADGHIEMTIGKDGNGFTIDRRVTMHDTSPALALQTMVGYADFNTTFSGDSTAILASLNVTKWTKNIHGSPYLDQVYSANSAVDSTVEAYVGSADQTFRVLMTDGAVNADGSITGAKYIYSGKHISTDMGDHMHDCAVLDSDDAGSPIMKFGAYRRGGDFNIYVNSTFESQVDGTVGYNHPSKSDGVIGYMTPNYDPTWTYTFEGSEIHQSGWFLDLNVNGVTGIGNWNHVYPIVGFNITKSTP